LQPLYAAHKLLFNPPSKGRKKKNREAHTFYFTFYMRFARVGLRAQWSLLGIRKKRVTAKNTPCMQALGKPTYTDTYDAFDDSPVHFQRFEWIWDLLGARVFTLIKYSQTNSARDFDKFSDSSATIYSKRAKIIE
jgi:hypothetical protein